MLRRNHVHHNREAGANVHDEGLGTFEDNDVTGNAEAGFDIRRTATPRCGATGSTATHTRRSMSTRVKGRHRGQRPDRQPAGCVAHRQGLRAERDSGAQQGVTQRRGVVSRHSAMRSVRAHSEIYGWCHSRRPRRCPGDAQLRGAVVGAQPAVRRPRRAHDHHAVRAADRADRRRTAAPRRLRPRPQRVHAARPRERGHRLRRRRPARRGVHRRGDRPGQRARQAPTRSSRSAG